MADHRVVALLGTGVVPTDTPILRADDLGAVRGDGIFEAMHVRDGQIWLLAEHLARMARSAARLELALPSAAALSELAEQAVAAWPATLEGALRLVCTRGRESDPAGAVTVFATVGPVGEKSRQARRDGVRVLSATIGVPAELRGDAPWLLGGAKTLSYAVSMASLRWAERRGADDVLWVSSDGYILEAPTASVVWLTGTVLHTVPSQRTGILPGTTARWLLDHADKLGWTTAETIVTLTQLLACDGAWLLSSVRGIAPILTVDDAPLAFPTTVTSEMRSLLGFA